MKTVLHIVSATVFLGSLLFFLNMGFLWLAPFLAVMVLLAYEMSLIAALLFGIKYRLAPKWIERPCWQAWKDKLLEESIHPLVDFPFRLYLADGGKADQYFEEGGLFFAQAKTREWLDEYPARAAKGIANIVKELNKENNNDRAG